MPEKFLFGDHLRQKGLISDTQLVEALRYQNDHSPNFEQLAVSRFGLSMNEVLRIYDRQIESNRDFAEIACSEGLLSKSEVRLAKELLETQRLPLGEVLQALSILSAEAVHQELAAFRAKTGDLSERMTLLRQISIFQSMSERALLSLAKISERKHYQAGETIVCEGDIADGFFCVAEGDLEVNKNSSEGDAPIYLTTLGKNDVIGESAVFEEQSRTANVFATTDATLLGIGRKPFLRFLLDYPADAQPVLMFIIRRLMMKLSSTNDALAFERKNFMSQNEIEQLMENLADATDVAT